MFDVNLSKISRICCFFSRTPLFSPPLWFSIGSRKFENTPKKSGTKPQKNTSWKCSVTPNRFIPDSPPPPTHNRALISHKLVRVAPLQLSDEKRRFTHRDAFSLIKSCKFCEILPFKPVPVWSARPVAGASTVRTTLLTPPDGAWSHSAHFSWLVGPVTWPHPRPRPRPAEGEYTPMRTL